MGRWPADKARHMPQPCGEAGWDTLGTPVSSRTFGTLAWTSLSAPCQAESRLPLCCQRLPVTLPLWAHLIALPPRPPAQNPSSLESLPALSHEAPSAPDLPPSLCPSRSPAASLMSLPCPPPCAGFPSLCPGPGPRPSQPSRPLTPGYLRQAEPASCGLSLSHFCGVREGD